MPQNEIPIYQVDAFTEKPFAGNPAAVCFLDSARDDSWLQNVAAEMNLAETAFLIEKEDGFSLRWFTPAIEVDLCGHATLASAHALWETGKCDATGKIVFHTRSVILEAIREDSEIVLDFPNEAASDSSAPNGLLDALGVSQTLFVGKNRFDFLIELETEETLKALTPDFREIAKLDVRGVIVTTRSSSKEFDFVSRYFAPGAGIDEDPVTGSAHCCLGPYWANKLDRQELTGFQASARGGIVRVKVEEGRVKLKGKAITVLKGSLVNC